MAKILVVDDEADLELLIRQKFRKKIREQVYSFVFAKDGLEALELLKKEEDIDIVLSDINMPTVADDLFHDDIKQVIDHFNDIICCNGFCDSRKATYIDKNNRSFNRFID